MGDRILILATLVAVLPMASAAIAQAQGRVVLLDFGVLRRPVSVTHGKTVTSDHVLNLALNADVIVTGSATFRSIADVENPTENLVGIASSASEGAVTAQQLEVRPLRRPGEVLETVPGITGPTSRRQVPVCR